MLTLAGFLTPYLVAFATFPLLVGRVVSLWFVPFGACLLIALSPWLIPAELPMLRFLASISAAMLTLKVIDVSLDLRQLRMVTWKEYVDFLSNPFTLVRRTLANERCPSPKENLLGLLRGSLTCAVAVAVLVGLFRLDWSSVPFLIEHVVKVTALMLAIASGLTGAAAIWRLSGGTARDFMDRPFIARTPAEFWRRYNRNVQQFFWLNVFSSNRNSRTPIRTMIFVFGLSALLHELLFYPAVGRLQGYQIAFFAVQGLAAALTARVKVKGKLAVPWVAGTLAFNLLTSVLFFASIHSVAPFYSQELPAWLDGW
jgi:MBOAT, membrane-bound O-acyltransferase family